MAKAKSKTRKAPAKSAAKSSSKSKSRSAPPKSERARSARAKSTPSKSAPDANLLADLMKWAKAAGADAADALFDVNESISVAQRMGKREKLESSESSGLRLRAFVGQRQAFVSTTDFSPQALRDLAERVVGMARAVPEDPTCGIAPRELLATKWPDLDLDDRRRPSARSLVELAATAEDAARAVKGVTNSEGAEAGWGRTRMLLVTSNGFSGNFRRGGYSLSCAVLAAQEPHLFCTLEANRASEKRGTIPPIERTDLGSGLTKAGVIRSDGEVAHQVQNVATTDRVSRNLRDDGLWQSPNLNLQIQHVETSYSVLGNFVITEIGRAHV